ncbi:hypothetical protein D6D06_07790 [Aureobasidium pullulans]|nr:hypothetical protein D6D06_07790 [Aureobasidium pullulans]
MAPIPPTPDNNPALARYIAKCQAKAGATVPSSLPSNHTNRSSNRTTQIVNPKSRSCILYEWVYVENRIPFVLIKSVTPSLVGRPGVTLTQSGRPAMNSFNASRTAEKLAISNKRRGLISNSSVCSRAWIDLTTNYRSYLTPLSITTCKELYKLLRKDNLTRHHYLAWTNNLFKIPRPYVKANYVKALMRKDRTHTIRPKALPTKLRDMIYNSVLQFDTDGPC